MTDDGVRFYAIVQDADGARLTRETDNRFELLEWIEVRRRAGGTLVELAMISTGDAIANTLGAIQYGAARMRTDAQRNPN